MIVLIVIVSFFQERPWKFLNDHLPIKILGWAYLILIFMQDTITILTKILNK